MTLPHGSDVVFDVDPLAYAIDAAASTYRISPVKVEFTLIKAQLGIKWSGLEKTEQAETPVGATMREWFERATHLRSLCLYHLTIWRPLCLALVD